MGREDLVGVRMVAEHVATPAELLLMLAAAVILTDVCSEWYADKSTLGEACQC